jgi:hypothetical protein
MLKIRKAGIRAFFFVWSKEPSSASRHLLPYDGAREKADKLAFSRSYSNGRRRPAAG